MGCGSGGSGAAGYPGRPARDTPFPARADLDRAPFVVREPPLVAPPPAAPAVAPPPAAPDSGTDPDYGTCKEAKANGAGPYYQGKDPEYDWYKDADHDGVVCER